MEIWDTIYSINIIYSFISLDLYTSMQPTYDSIHGQLQAIEIDINLLNPSRILACCWERSPKWAINSSVSKTGSNWQTQVEFI